LVDGGQVEGGGGKREGRGREEGGKREGRGRRWREGGGFSLFYS